MAATDSPFRVGDVCLAEMKAACPELKVVVVDIHAEATSEKQATGWWFDGRASLVIGTHTHVPTADARILPKGTAYQGDAGMTGAYEGIIGFDPKNILERFPVPDTPRDGDGHARRPPLRRRRRRGRGDREGPGNHPDPGKAGRLRALQEAARAVSRRGPVRSITTGAPPASIRAWPSIPSSSPSSPARPATRGRP